MTDLLEYIETEKLEVIEDHIPIDKIKGLYFDSTIIIDIGKIDTSREKRCILAEEIGHHYTNSGHIINQEDISNRKQENKAREWAFNKLILMDNIIHAYQSGVRNRYELAEHLDVTESFLSEAIKYYQRKYGLFYEIKNYIIYFEPFSILEIL